jgi:hypothetical protein
MEELSLCSKSAGCLVNGLSGNFAEKLCQNTDDVDYLGQLRCSIWGHLTEDIWRS